MPDQIKDFGDFVVWRVSGEYYGTDIFICSHGGYDDSDGSFDLADYGSGKPNLYFYGAHGESISESLCNSIIASETPSSAAKSIMGPGSSCWNYMLAEYKKDWFEAATRSAKQAHDNYQVLHDCLLIKGSSGIVYLKEVVNVLRDEGIKYLNFHFMACRKT